jgi:hypothetical protein
MYRLFVPVKKYLILHSYEQYLLVPAKLTVMYMCRNTTKTNSRQEIEQAPFGVHLDFGVFGEKLKSTVLIRRLKPHPEHLRRPKILVQHSSRRSWKYVKGTILVGGPQQRHAVFGANKSF